MKQVLQRFEATPDTGSLKNTSAQYDFLQNIRGQAKLGSKRNGIKNRLSFSYGIMGLFDFYNDGDPSSLDRIGIITQDGTLHLAFYSELTSTFEYAISASGTLAQQSADGSWWQIAPNTSTGLLSVTGIAAPTSTRSTDLDVGFNELFGFLDSTGLWRLSINTDDPVPAPSTTRYNLASIITTYTTLAFTLAVGLVLQDDSLNRWRVTVDNTGTLGITGI